MSFKVIQNKRNKEVFVQARRSAELTTRGIRIAYFRLGNVLVDEARKLIRTGPKTGRIYRIRGRRHQASAPGQAPANLTGLLARSIAYQQRGGFQMRFGARAEYAPFLELGTSKMDERPFLITAIENREKEAENFFEQEIENELKRGMR